MLCVSELESFENKRELKLYSLKQDRFLFLKLEGGSGSHPWYLQEPRSLVGFSFYHMSGVILIFVVQNGSYSPIRSVLQTASKQKRG